jgi:vitamin K-dependent gamma-carboxylase
MIERTQAKAGTFFDKLAEVLLRPTDVVALAVFRLCFGLLGFVSALRFMAYGWVEQLFTEPRHFLHYWGFDWIVPLSARGMSWLFVTLAITSACVALGFLYRAAIITYFLAFTYIQLIDVTNYLNHYYLVSLLAFLMSFLPLHRAYSVDAWLFPRRKNLTLPAWCTYLLRFQVGIVYFYAGLAKVNSDWLFHAQPLNVWLSARTYLPVIGPILGQHWVALVMSWAGCLFDLSIVFFLLWSRTRLLAYLVVIVFHVVTKTLFPIGMFPFIMVVGALVFFSPSWPRNVLAALGKKWPAPENEGPSEGARFSKTGKVFVAFAAMYCVFHVVWPLRTHAYGGNVSWHEQGMRFSWRVMLREKNGSVTYLVTNPKTGKIREISPRRYLNGRQERDYSTQPDLILQVAHWIANDFEQREGIRPIVRAEALVSLNGRPAQWLIDPNVDLARIQDGVGQASWILPSPTHPPVHLEAVAWHHR